MLCRSFEIYVDLEKIISKNQDFFKQMINYVKNMINYVKIMIDYVKIMINYIKNIINSLPSASRYECVFAI